MELERTVKGRVGEAIVKAVLTAAGYRVVPFGVEESLREVSILDGLDYCKLRKDHLPDALTSMPDFLVATKKLDQVWTVEVKYCGKWSDFVHAKLEKPLSTQARIWGKVVLVVVFRSFKGGGAAVRCLRLSTSSEAGTLVAMQEDGEPIGWNDVREGHFQKLKKVFSKVKEVAGDSELAELLDTGLLG